MRSSTISRTLQFAAKRGLLHFEAIVGATATICIVVVVAILCAVQRVYFAAAIQEVSVLPAVQVIEPIRLQLLYTCITVDLIVIVFAPDEVTAWPGLHVVIAKMPR